MPVLSQQVYKDKGDEYYRIVIPFAVYYYLVKYSM